MELSGQTAIVTGAGRGIGRAVALELAGMGADIVVAELDTATGESVAEEVRSLGRRALALCTDVTQRADLEAMVSRTVDEFGRIDVLVNNAAIYRAQPVLEISEAHWDRMMDLNVRALFFASQAVLPHMLAAQRGAIVNVASVAAMIASGLASPYCASKAAVISITRSLALAVAADGVRVNAVCPGYVQTEMWAQLEEEVSAIVDMPREEFSRQRLAQIPLRRWEQPEDVARVVAFLASERSAYITGEAVNVSGGLVMH